MDSWNATIFFLRQNAYGCRWFPSVPEVEEEVVAAVDDRRCLEMPKSPEASLQRDDDCSRILRHVSRRFATTHPHMESNDHGYSTASEEQSSVSWDSLTWRVNETRQDTMKCRRRRSHRSPQHRSKIKSEHKSANDRVRKLTAGCWEVLVSVSVSHAVRGRDNTTRTKEHWVRFGRTWN